MIENTQDNLRRSLGVSDLEHTFTNFKTVTGTTEAYRASKQFSETLTPPLLLCYGGIGNGKTYLLEAIAIRLRERNIRASLMVWYERMSYLKSRMKADGMPTYDQLLESLQKANLLLIDDYGMGNVDSEWNRSILEIVIDYRYRHRLPIALTTNKKLEDLPARVVSRFSEKGIGLIVENKGGDYRQRGNK